MAGFGVLNPLHMVIPVDQRHVSKHMGKRLVREIWSGLTGIRKVSVLFQGRNVRGCGSSQTSTPNSRFISYFSQKIIRKLSTHLNFYSSRPACIGIWMDVSHLRVPGRLNFSPDIC